MRVKKEKYNRKIGSSLLCTKTFLYDGVEFRYTFASGQEYDIYNHTNIDGYLRVQLYHPAETLAWIEGKDLKNFNI